MAGWAPVANLIRRRSDGATGEAAATAGSKQMPQQLLEVCGRYDMQECSENKNKNWL